MADLGTGATLSWAQDATVASLDITNLDWSGGARESVDTSHMGTVTAKTHIVSALFEPGELSVDYLVNTTEFGTGPFIIQSNGEDEGDITITLRDASAGTAATWVSSGAMTAWSQTAPFEGVITGNLTFKLSGIPTFTDAV